MSASQICNGCGETSPVTMQCPLCQAEGTVEGFFCSQACFAANWLAHRDSAHKKGAVKEKKRAEMDEKKKKLQSGEMPDAEGDEDAATAGKKLKKKVKKATVVAVAPNPIFDGRWKDLPSSAQCSATKTGVIQPAITAKKMPPRVVVSVKNEMTAAAAAAASSSLGSSSSFAAPSAIQQNISVDDATNCSAVTMWSAATAAANLIATNASGLNMTDNQVVIVAGSAVSAFAAAWALRSAGAIPAAQIELVLSTDKASIAVAPNDRPNKAPIRIVTVAVLAAISAAATTGESPPSAATLDAWLANKLMLTMPDVRSPESLQTLTTRAVFFITDKNDKKGAEAAAEEGSSSPSKKLAGKKRSKAEAEAEEDDEALAPTHTVTPLTVSCVPAPNTVFPISSGGPSKGATLEDVIGGGSGKSTQNSGAAEDDEQLAEAEAETEMTGVEAETARVATHRRFALCGLHDDTLAHLLNRNDLMQIITHLRNLYNTVSSKKFTEMVANALLCDRGGDLLFAQHKLAMILWMSTVTARANGSGNSGSISNGSGNRSTNHNNTTANTSDSHNFLQTITKCVIRAATTFPIAITAVPKAKNRFISLQATLSFLHGAINEALLDQLAAVWDIDEFILGYKELSFLDGHRKDIVTRLSRNYGVKLENGEEHTKMLIILYHLLCNLTHKYTLTVADVALITQWNVYFAFHFGPLNTFIATAELTAGNDRGNKAASLLSRKSKKEQAAESSSATISAVAAALTPTTFLKPTAHQQNLPLEKVPVHLRYQKQDMAMARAACDEILSAMPRVPIPMFIGDVGQLIGIWPKFNARFGGKLGLKLSDFLMKFPERFRIMGNLVTRLQESFSEPIRIRFDNDIEEDSDDENGNGGNTSKRRTKITAAAGGKTLHRKAIRRQAKKDRNKARFNKNHQQFDSSAKVPGYTKPKPKKVKGRGKKPNIRRFKREA